MKEVAVKDATGVLKRISGPVVTAVGLQAHMYDVVKVGKEELMGEVIKIKGDNIIIQVYEDTSGIRPGEPVSNTGLSLAVELGPGLLKSIYDGIQRPLSVLVDKMGNFIERGVTAPGLSRETKWDFVPVVKAGDKVGPGYDHRGGPGDKYPAPRDGPAQCKARRGEDNKTGVIHGRGGRLHP